MCERKGAGYTAMHDRDERGWPIPGTFNYDFWVCANCLRPARMVFEKLTHKTAPARATCIKSVVGDSAGRNIITWGTEVSGEKIKTMMFHAYPRKMDMDQGRNICLELWHKLDESIDTIRANPGHDMEHDKTRANTLAETIQLIMSPFYADTQAVLAESMTRWKARQDGTEHESPGLAESIWDPSTRFDGTPYSKEAESRARSRSGGARAAKPPVQFDEQKRTFIKHTLENGQMTPEVLAGMFNCSVEDIKGVMDK